MTIYCPRLSPGHVGLADLTDQDLDPGLPPCMLLHGSLLPEALVLLTLMTLGLTLTLASDCDDDTDCTAPAPHLPRRCCEDRWCTDNDYQGQEGLCCIGQICRKRACAFNWQCGVHEKCDVTGGSRGVCKAALNLLDNDLLASGSGSGDVSTLDNGFWDMED